MRNNYLNTVYTTPAQTPQTQPLDTKQVANSAGGFSYQISDLDRLRRFLILGSEGGSYYASEKKLTQDNAAAVLRVIKADGLTAVREIVAISDAGRAPKNDPALFALAMAASFGDDQTRAAALAALPRVARIGTHLFHFADYINGMRGWGRGLRNAVGNWYTEKDARSLAYQVVKYGQRDGWSHDDLLRLSHPKTGDEQLNSIFHYITKGWEGVGTDPHPDAALALIWAAESAKTASDKEIVRLIEQYGLPMEAIPTDKRSARVYETLLNQKSTGLTWILRNLGNLGKQGVLVRGAFDNINRVADRLTDEAQLAKARVHPLSILVALNTYSAGHGMLGNNSWEVVPAVKDALNEAFDKSFQAITPTGKNFLLGIDVSGSMGWNEIAGMKGITPRVGSAAMAMATVRSERNTEVMAFSNTLVPVNVGKRDSLETVQATFNRIPMGGTDCSLPMIYATDRRIKVDGFVVYTDSETYAGRVHPVQALRTYRDKMGIDAKLVVVGMVSNGFTIADSSDRGMLDVVGFDTAAPAVISEFVAGSM